MDALENLAGDNFETREALDILSATYSKGASYEMLTRHAYLLFTLLLIASWGFVFAKIPGVGLIFRGLCLAFVTLGVVSTAIRRLVAGKSTQTTQLDKAKEVRFVDEVELPAAA